MPEGRVPRRVAVWLVAALAALFVVAPSAVAAPSTAWNGSGFDIDTANVVRRANIVLGSPPLQASQLMGLGNGQLGAAVWGAGGFTAQINRTDTWPTRKSPGQVTIPGLAPLTNAERLQRQRRPLRRHLPPAGRRDDRDDLRARRQGRTGRRRHRRRPEHDADRAHQPAERPQPDRGRGRRDRAPGRDVGGHRQRHAAAPAGRSARSRRSPPAAARSPPRVVDARTVEVSFKPNADGSFRVIVGSPTWAGGDARRPAQRCSAATRRDRASLRTAPSAVVARLLDQGRPGQAHLRRRHRGLHGEPAHDLPLRRGRDRARHVPDQPGGHQPAVQLQPRLARPGAAGTTGSGTCACSSPPTSAPATRTSTSRASASTATTSTPSAAGRRCA